MIEPGKHHLILGIAGTDKNFPITQWDRLIPQTQETLNMMWPCRINPKLSADSFLEGQHNYNAVTFPPIGWRMLIFDGPEKKVFMGFPCGRRLQYRTGGGKLQVLLSISNVKGSSTNFRHSGVFHPVTIHL